MDRKLVEKIVKEAQDAKCNLVIWDRRDTFTVEAEDVDEIEVASDHLRAKMQDGKVIVYVALESVYKLVVEKERTIRPGIRAGFGAAKE